MELNELIQIIAAVLTGSALPSIMSAITGRGKQRAETKNLEASASAQTSSVMLQFMKELREDSMKIREESRKLYEENTELKRQIADHEVKCKQDSNQ